MRPALLALCQSLPYPPHSGVASRTFNVLLQLQRAFDVHLVAFSRHNHQPDAAARAAARNALSTHLTGVEEPVPITSERSRVHQATCHLLSSVTRRPYTFFEYASPAFARGIRAACGAQPPALIHMDSLDLYRWLDALPPVPIAVTHHSVESDLLRSRARRVGSPLLSAYLGFQAGLMEALERKLCPRLPLNVMMSDADADKLTALAPGTRTLTVPNGVDTDYFAPRAGAARPGTVVFLGPTYMYPNRDAVDWFLDAMWPAVRAALPAAALHLVGKNAAPDRARYEREPGVVCHGYVPDVRPHLAAAQCSIVPIRVGGGTRLKILDSWAMGIPVVSTSTGCEGLATVDGQNILICDDAAGFSRAVTDVLTSPDLRARLGTAGRETATRRYAWRAIGDGLVAAYQALLHDSRDALARTAEAK